MEKSSQQVHLVDSFESLISTPFSGKNNAHCWTRQLDGNFEEIVEYFTFSGNILEIDEDDLKGLSLSEQGKSARSILLNDLKLLTEYGASPVLNIIKCYNEDDSYDFISTDVYSWHVDRSTIASDTILVTYHGASSDIVDNQFATQKILIPEIKKKLQLLHQKEAPDLSFEQFVADYFFDLHYEVDISAPITNLGLYNMWRLACDHVDSNVLPCVHRAPKELDGKKRLMIIC